MKCDRCFFLAAVVATLFAAPQMAAPQDSIRTVQLHVTPKAEPQPALQYRLEVPYKDQRMGNAALLYNTAISWVRDVKSGYADFDSRKLADWQNASVGKLPIEEVRRLISRFGRAIEYAEMASRCEQCVWEYPMRERGMATLLPGLSEYRDLSRVLALKTRLEVRDGNIAEAMNTLGIGFSIARDVGKGPSLLHGLVGLAIASHMHREIEGLIQRAEAPNLYWALTEMPQPLVSFHRALQAESQCLYIALPELRTLDERVLSNDEVTGLWRKLGAMADMETDSGDWLEQRLAGIVGTSKVYRQARQWLIDRGRSAQEVESLPIFYVVLLHDHHRYECLWDEQLKWFSMSYWQAADELEDIQTRIKEYAEESSTGELFAAMFPSLRRVFFLDARYKRDLAMLRCVEALRIYAAAHDGHLPSSLSDITEVPVPLDPLYGRAFFYEVTGNQAVLESPAPAEGRPREGLRYEIALR